MVERRAEEGEAWAGLLQPIMHAMQKPGEIVCYVFERVANKEA